MNITVNEDLKDTNEGGTKVSKIFPKLNKTVREYKL